MVIDDFSGEKGKIKVLSHRIDDMGKVIIDTPAGPTRTMAPQPEECFMESELPDVGDNTDTLYNNLVDVMNGRTELIVTPETVKRTMLVIEAVFESARENAAITVDI